MFCVNDILMQEDLAAYGIDYDGPLPLESNESSNVTVPVTNIPCSQQRHQQLVELINPFRLSDNYGIDILLDVLAFLQGSE